MEERLMMSKRRVTVAAKDQPTCWREFPRCRIVTMLKLKLTTSRLKFTMFRLK
jgi:hypothetical protein